jgi:hypothetical protein
MMRLSDDKARRLTWLVWRDRAVRWLPILALVVALAGIVVFATDIQMQRADPTVDVKAHEATVLDTKRTMARGAAVVHVHLDDGRDVDAISLFRVPPSPGAHVLVNEARHASGKYSYDVVRFAQ